MKPGSTFGLENAAWPTLIVDQSGAIRSANQAAAAAFGAIMETESPLLANIWAAGNSVGVDQFLLRIDRSATGALPIKLKVRGGSVADFVCLACSATRDQQRFFTLQFFRTGSAAAPSLGPGELASALPSVVPIRENLPSEDSVRIRLDSPGPESAAMHKQKLECALQLTRTVALDFNNALTSILGHTSFLLTRMSSDHPWRHSLMEVEKSAEKAAEIAHDLAAFSRQDKDPRSQVSGNLNQVLRRTVALFQKPGPATIEWELSLENRLHSTSFDEAKMQQALLRILENAVQSIEGQGRISVRSFNHVAWEVQHDETVELAPGQYVCTEVSDTGCGIPMDVLPRVFEPFFTTKPNPPHRGLGLAWVYGIVTNHGGSVAISSPPGQGTSVRVYLPAQSRFVPDQPAQDEDLNGSGKVLVVDDEDLLLSMGETVLSSFGYQVVTANSGAKALEIFCEDPAAMEIVITDLVMPQMSGRELIDRLRHLRPDVKILCMSGYVRTGGFEGTEAYLQKPFTSQALLRKVKQVLTQTPSET